ncbi:MAG: hypothetical protein LBV30_08900 [Propionibacteriaceae bacterium]|nr:hypothetical protein [Propionibacteriaceae bacterium]
MGDLIWLPQGVRSTVDADQPNLVIVSGLADQSSQVLAFLELSLPDLGWRISDRSPEALMFEQAPWQGAFVIVDDQWALTARNDS